ncbi:hypothetical protein C0585_00280 [Candidatus Woesearchaeota archaeon]|nr:MAG: hypothetical protein C0585_00280 [Candidatus Woesearchaeota archaeon]
MLEFFRLAIINIKEKRTRSWLTLLGIFIGIASVVALIGLGDGLKLAISSQFGISSTEVLTVQAGGITGAGPPGSAVSNPLTLEDSDAIEKLDTVEYSIPRVLKTGKLEFNDRLIFGFAMTIPDGEKRDYAYEILDIGTEQGRLLKDGDTKKVVLGYNFFADKVGLDRPVNVGDRILIQDEEFEVVGITEKKGSFIFDNIVHMNEEVMLDLFDHDDSVNIIAVKAKNKDVLDKAKEDIEELLRKRRDVKVGEEDFNVQTPESILDTVNTVLSGVQIFVGMIAAISIIVGALGIVNTMLTSVLERKNQIGVMKAIGAKNSDIFFIFFFESGLMGLIGGVVGVAFGSLISYFGTKGIHDFVGTDIGVSLNLFLIFGALLGSFMVGSIAGIIPAMRAAKENPVEAIRG